MVSLVENVNYGNVKFTIVISKNNSCIYNVTIDNATPCSCEETKNAVSYVFYLTCGQHTVEIGSIPIAKNGIGKFHCILFSYSPYNRYLNHLFAFSYAIAHFKMKLNLIIHREATMEICVEQKEYVTFLNTASQYLCPRVLRTQNIKQNHITVDILDKYRQKKFFHRQALIWSLYFFLFLAVFIPLAVINILNWNVDSGIAGHNGAFLFVMGSFPTIILSVCSYFYYLHKLWKQYKNATLFSQI